MIKYCNLQSIIANDRILIISEDITRKLAAEVCAMLLYYDMKNNEDIIMYINTNGGNVDSLLNIYDIMKSLKSDIQTICIGRAYSAGALLLSSGTKGKRLITKNSSVMIHGLQFDLSGAANGTSQAELEPYFNFLEESNKLLIELFATNTNKSFEKVENDCKIDKYLTAQEALEYEIVDYII